MTGCLTPGEFVDLEDGTLAAGRRAHLDACPACRGVAAEVREAMTLAADADVPEPSSLFWSSVNARVRAEIEATAVGGWRAWMRWDVVVPMAGLAALVVVLAVAVDRQVPSVPPASAGAGLVDVAAAAPASDDALAMMSDLAAGLPEGGWDALGMTALPEMGVAAAVLSADERRALAALLKAAIDRPVS